MPELFDRVRPTYPDACHNLVDTEKAGASGNGTYSTPTGYTLPRTAAAGTYQWDATYSGDSDNASVSDNNNPCERVTVHKASPSDPMSTHKFNLPDPLAVKGDDVLVANRSG